MHFLSVLNYSAFDRIFFLNSNHLTMNSKRILKLFKTHILTLGTPMGASLASTFCNQSFLHKVFPAFTIYNGHSLIIMEVIVYCNLDS